MNRLWRIFLVSMSAISLMGCEDISETNLEQRDDIISYLTSSHSPKLISESDLAESLDTDPAFYSTGGYITFMYIETFYDEGRELKTQIKNGSKVSLTLTLYDFEGETTPSTSTLLFTNDSIQIATLEAAGLNTTYWSSEPLTITIGKGELFSSVESLLVGCKEEDVIEFYLTLNDAYGTSVIGMSTAEAPLALFCEILEVY